MVHLVYTLLKGTFCSVLTSFPKKGTVGKEDYSSFVEKNNLKGSLKLL